MFKGQEEKKNPAKEILKKQAVIVYKIVEIISVKYTQHTTKKYLPGKIAAVWKEVCQRSTDVFIPHLQVSLNN